MGIGRLKTPAGLLEIYLALSGGTIENVMITGDFFSTTQDISRLENALKWSSARAEMIKETLSKGRTVSPVGVEGHCWTDCSAPATVSCIPKVE